MTEGRTGVRVAFALAAVGVLAAGGWVVAGDVLPGGRWAAVHVFTLLVLSPLVLALSQHFAATLTHRPDHSAVALLVAFTAGSLALLVGVPAGSTPLVTAGATVTSTVTLLGYVRLRRHRKATFGDRFTWVVRLYERAHGAFLHGALLGALLGTGVLRGEWYVTGRLAHLHVNVLGWAGLTLLGTLVFLGPTVLRRRIEPGADHAAARWTKHGGTGLSIGVLALLVSAVGGWPGTTLRLTAAAGLALFAIATVVVCRPVVRTALRGSPAGGRWPLAAGCAWLVVAVVGDVAVVAAGAWQFVTTVEVVLLLGALLQVVQAVAMHLVPLLVDRAGRSAARDALDRGVVPRTAVGNLGVLLLVEASLLQVLDAAPVVTTATARIGWALTLAAVLHLLVGAARAVNGDAARHRGARAASTV